MGLISQGSAFASSPGRATGFLRCEVSTGALQAGKRQFDPSLGLPTSSMAAYLVPDDASAWGVQADPVEASGDVRPRIAQPVRVIGEGLGLSPAVLVRIARALRTAGGGVAAGDIRFDRTVTRLRVRGVIAAPPTPDDVASAVMDGSFIEPGLTFREAMRLIAATLAGRVSGAEGSTIVFRAAGSDHKVRLTVTADSDGNRLTIAPDTEA